MENQAYYRFASERESNVVVSDRALVVNCTGLYMSERSFVTDNRAGREDYYIQYLVEGELYQLVGEEELLMLPGDAVLHLPHCRYRYRSGTPGMKYYWVHFSGSEVKDLLGRCGLLSGGIIRVGLHKRLTSGFEQMFGEFIRRDEYSELSLSHIMMKLAVDLARLRENGNAQSSDDRIGRVAARMHRCFDRELTIAGLAAEEYMSEGRLRVLFKERYGISPHRYLTALRIDNARELLEQPDLQITEIAAAVGIPDALYFSRIFRDCTGVSPTEYRRQSML